MGLARLKKRSEFLAANRGRKFAAPGLVLQARRRKEPDETGDMEAIRVGFTATKKVGGAVSRNRIKRRLRAAADQILPENGKPRTDYVLIGRAKTLLRPFDLLLEDLAQALHMINAPEIKARTDKDKH